MADSITHRNIVAALEALLFVYGEPLGVKRISQILGISQEEADTAIKTLEELYRNNERGLALARHEEKIQLVTKPDFGDILQTIVHEAMQEQLTGASAETLAIIAYRGPIARAQIDYVRGVNSSFILRTLLIRGLVERKPDPARPHVYLYGISFELLKKLGVRDAGEFPDYQKYRELLDRFLNPQPINNAEEKTL